jgi:hypothetical protein
MNQKYEKLKTLLKELVQLDQPDLDFGLYRIMHAVVQWAERTGTRWAFSLSNAGAHYTEFRSRLDELDQLDWEAITATDFRPAEVKERKQAEFLLHGRFPFEPVERIGVRSADIQARAATALAGGRHRPPIEVRQEWYF